MSVNANPKGVLAAMLAASLLCSGAALSAQSRGGFAQGSAPLLGPELGVGTNSLNFFIGTQFAYPVANRFDFYPSFQYYFPGNNFHAWTLEGAARYWPNIHAPGSGLYVGAGLNYTHTSLDVGPLGSVGNSDAGLSLFGGWDFKRVSFRPFAQIRIVLGNDDRVDFGGGMNFRL